MRREDVGAPHRLQRRVGVVVVVIHQMGDPRQRHESRVSLVHVAHLGHAAQRRERLEAADAEQEFLMEAHPLVAAVEPPGDLAQFGRVLGQFGVEQHQRDVADPEDPRGEEEFAVAEAHQAGDFVAVGVASAHHRQIVDLGDGIVFVLPAGTVEHLPEVALPIEQPHRHQRQFEVARGFQVVAGEDAEAARKDADALVDAEFEREVRDLAPGDAQVAVIGLALVLLADAVQQPQVAHVVREFFEAALRHPAQKGLGAAGEFPPQPRVDAHEEVDRRRMPAPPDVVGQFFEEFQFAGDARRHVVKLNRHDVGVGRAALRSFLSRRAHCRARGGTPPER